MRAADQAESDAYDAALSAALDRPSLREDERVWFQSEILTAGWFFGHGMKVDPEKLRESYVQRAASLRAIAQQWRTFRRPIPASQLGTACLSLPSATDATDCAVTDSGGVVGASEFRYQRQSYHHEAKAHGIIVFAAADGSGTQWVPIAAAYNPLADFTAPETVDSPEGKLMMLAATANEANAEGASDLYRFASGTLEDIDDRAWLDTLKSRVPDGMLFEPGIMADYGKMTATATIARSESSCCPVGGHAVITLAIEDQRVVVKDLTFEPQ